MRINSKYYINQSRSDKSIRTNLFDGRDKIYHTGDDDYYTYLKIMRVCRKRQSDSFKNAKLDLIYSGISEVPADHSEFLFNGYTYTPKTTTSTSTSTSTDVSEEVVKKNLKEAITKLIDFFSEFHYTPSYRFLNTFANCDNPKDYVVNYFSVMDFNYATEIQDKVSSPEFTDIVKNLKKSAKKTINNRMKIYYGEPGTGKTTTAMNESNKCVVCSSDMLPTDLMQNFGFDDGKATFEKSDLWEAMENGETIILDEINMLPFESLRFLQGITDGKEFIDYKGFRINIAEGFNIIGTMNLNVNGQSIALPEPLVDRCSDIKEFKLDANALINALV